jgi:hypothetical protein
MTFPTWISAVEFSEVADMCRQVANRLCASFSEGRKTTWHGQPLEVRIVMGRGGKSGKQYQVRVSSLPLRLQERLKASQITDEALSKLRFGDKAQFERNWKYDLISRAMEHPKGSSERKAEIFRLHGRTVHDWTGRVTKLSKSTIYKWIESFELYGVHGLTSKVRKDKGEKKVSISRAWTKAVPFDDGMKAAIEHDVKQYIRSLLKQSTSLGVCQVLAAEKLEEITVAYGYRASEARRDEIFAIPRTFVDEEVQAKAVARHKFDRKASVDDQPRIRRTTAKLDPMEVIVMDVHHLDIHVAREDGSYSTPKLIAFHDIATGRVFAEIIQFDNRGGVRNADIITGFTNMCQHSAFGVPQFLYVDNGSEYAFADDLEDALKLGSKVIGFDGSQDRNRVIRSIAYNAAAKHVEGWFGRFEQHYLKHIQGWRGGQPMNPKRPDLGKLHDPYPHGFDAFCEELYGLLRAYENIPQQGGLAGKSPALAYKKHVDAGWAATILDSDQLLTVFTRPETRVVRQHGIRLGNSDWTCEGLLSYFGRRVVAHIPKYHGFAELLITDEHGAEIGIAVSDQQFDVLDGRGAKESARRKSARNKALTAIDKSIPDIDAGAAIIAFGEKKPLVTPNAPKGTISVDRRVSQRRAILPVPANNVAWLEEEERIRVANREAAAAMAIINSNMRNR